MPAMKKAMKKRVVRKKSGMKKSAEKPEKNAAAAAADLGSDGGSSSESGDVDMAEGAPAASVRIGEVTRSAAARQNDGLVVEDEDNSEDGDRVSGNEDVESADEAAVPAEDMGGNGSEDAAPAPDQDEESHLVADEQQVVVEQTARDPYLLKDAAYIKSDPNWKNKQRTLLFSTRGISGQHRHLMEDLKRILPHHKVESKVEKSQDFSVVNEIAELKSCNNVCFFEARKHQDLYLHVARVPHGPTVKFQVLNIHTSGEVKMSGNCLMHSRPLLTFDQAFDQLPHLNLVKELFVQTFGTPRNHPKSKPFHDHAIGFYYADEKIWVRHYQITPLTDADANDPEKQTLTEIGPRFVLDPIWILQGSFSGKKIYHNSTYSTPTLARRMEKQKLGVRAKVRAEQDEVTRLTKKKMERVPDPTDAIFEEFS